MVAGRWSFALDVAAVMLGALAPSRAQDLGIEIGSAAPAAKVHTLDGKEADLAQYIGKTPIVMEFWATWCPNCEELEPTLARGRQEVRHAGEVRRRRGVGESERRRA